MGDIFTSYSRLDSEIVDKFVGAMSQAGIRAWLDREDIQVGSSWRVQIVEAIDTCDAFVLMLSANSAASKNVHKEVILAQDSGRPTYVVMLEVVRLPPEIRYQLAGLQFINLPLLGFEKSAEKLIEVLKPHLKKIEPAGEQSHKQTELVIQGIDVSAFTAEKQEQLLAFISNLANADQSQLKIANVTAGSVHVFMDMPADIAFQLKTLALNSDARFQELGITSLRLAGDANFINISLGLLTAAATIGPIKSFWLKIQSQFSSIFGLTLGNIMLTLTAAVLTIGIGLSALSLLTTPSLASPPADNGAEQATATFTLTAGPTATDTPTATPTLTSTPTNTPEPVFETLNGIVAEHLACLHGPGELFLYRYGLIEGIKLQVLGRDINSGWAYVQADGYEGTCWVNLNQITLEGDTDSLKVLYPGEVEIPLSFLWPEPQNVYAARTKAGDQVAIYWDEYILPGGELESPQSPRYLAELWLCQDGVLTFNSIFAWQNNLLVTDEPGCSDASGGVIYLVEKHGYAGPVEVPWPPHPASAP